MTKHRDDGRPAFPGKRVRWVALAALGVWTVFVIAAVWWLGGGSAQRPELLIALDRAEPASWTMQIRRWINSHVESYRAYPWIMLAPYVVWVSLQVARQRWRLGWRCAVQGAVGAGFVGLSQALTQRFDALRPRAILIRHEGVVRQGSRAGAGAEDVLARTVEWHGVVDGDAKILPLVASLPPPFGGTNPPGLSNLNITNRVVERRTAGGWTNGGQILRTNDVFVTLPTNGTPELAQSLANVIQDRFLEPPPFRGIVSPRKYSAALDVLAYLALVGLAQAIHFRQRLAERDLHAASLEAKLTQSRLHALQSQLQPHFLFNALNGIATLVRRDPRVAEEMLASLSELLRAALAQSGRQEVPLREELEFIDRYLELQQMRFGDRLRVERDIAAEALDCPTPSLVLQPLVENAIRHGLEPSPHPGLIRLTAQRRAGRLILTVEDNGVGLPKDRPASSPGNGIGLASVRERLAALYGERHEWTLREKPEGGVLAQISIPDRSPAGDSSSRTESHSA